MLVLDHLAVSATDLDDGADQVSAALGVQIGPAVGLHPQMATHNRLIGLGDLYLEVIAVNQDAPAPDWPRWFNLDHFAGPARLTNWVCGCDDLEAELTASPPGTGAAVDLERGDFRWRMAVPQDGRLPLDGAFPALIQWQGAAHPTRSLPDKGVRLTRLEIAHPQADVLRVLMAPRLADARVVFVPGREKEMRATFSTQRGPRTIE